MASQNVQNAVANFRADLNDQICTTWRTNWARPLADAHETAFRNIKTAMGAQAEQMKRRAEFALAVLGIIGGNVATGIFGAACAKSLAAKLTKDLVVKKNWERALKVINAAEKSSLAKFALGSLWDTGAQFLSDETKQRVTTRATKAYSSMTEFGKNPWNYRTSLLNFVDDNQRTIGGAASDLLTQGSGSDEERLAALEKLKKAAFMKPPASKPDQAKMALDIELTLWMTWLLDTDSLVVTRFSGNSVTASASVTSRTKIAKSPSAADYPKTRELERKIHRGLFGIGVSGTSGKRQDVRYAPIGSKLNDRIDVVHKQRQGQEFFKDGYSWTPNERNSRDVLLRAERVLRAVRDRNPWKIG